MENIVMYLKLVRGIRGALLAYVVEHHIKVAHISPWSSAYLNLDEEIIPRAPSVTASLNLKICQDMLDRAYLNHQTDTWKIENSMVYQILSEMFTDMDTFCLHETEKSHKGW